MGKKTDRIRALEAETATLRKQLHGVSAMNGRIAAQRDHYRRLAEGRRPSLMEQARQRAVELGDRVLEAVGF